LSGRIGPPAQGAQEFGILFFLYFGQVKSLAFITRAVFHEEIGCVGSGLKVTVRQTVGHDESYSLVFKDVGPGENRHIHPALIIRSGQHPMPFGIFEVSAQIHH
jgi:hypothetical protein